MKRTNDEVIGLHCMACSHERLDVIDSRASVNSVRRRRRCPQCKWKATTYEIVAPAVNDDYSRLRDALRLYTRVRSLREDQRAALFAMIAAMSRHDARSAPGSTLEHVPRSEPLAIEDSLLQLGDGGMK